MASHFAKGHLTLIGIYLLIFVLGIASARAVVHDAVVARNLSIGANSTGIKDTVSPGGCGANEILEWSECGCNNIITSHCWTSGGVFGSAVQYKSACSLNTQCMPSIGKASTASCVDNSNFYIWDVMSSGDYSSFTFAGFGSVQVVIQALGGCPPSLSPNYAQFWSGNGYIGRTTPASGSYYFLSPAFTAGNEVGVRVYFDGNGPLTVAVTTTSAITDKCQQCTGGG